MKRKKKPTVASFFAGSASGAVKICFTYPLDTIKSTQQLVGTSIFSTARHVWSSRGFGGFYVGSTAALLQQIGKVGVQFTAWEWWFYVLKSMQSPLRNEDTAASSPFITFTSGVLAGVVEAALWTAPTERLKLVQQAELQHKESRQFVGLARTLNSVLKQQGLQGVFQGILPTAIRQGTSLGVRFLAYSQTKRLLETVSQESAAWQAPVGGAISGACACALNQPIDVVKTRIQGLPPHSQINIKQRSFGHVMKSIWKEEGLTALWRGLSARAMKVGLGQAIVFFTYARITEAFGTISSLR